MKKLLTTLLFFSLIAPVTALAADFSGVYIAPKIIGGIQQGTANTYINDIRIPLAEKSFSKGVFGGGLAIGYDFGNSMGVPLRLEVEYAAFTTANATKTATFLTPSDAKAQYHSSLQSLFLNAYFDIDTGSNFTPYVGAGLGIGFNRFKATYNLFGDKGTLGSHRSSNFAWNIGVGCAYNFTDNIAVDFGYRYAQFGKGKTRTYYESPLKYVAKTGTIGMHQFVLGLRVSF